MSSRRATARGLCWLGLGALLLVPPTLAAQNAANAVKAAEQAKKNSTCRILTNDDLTGKVVEAPCPAKAAPAAAGTVPPSLLKGWVAPAPNTPTGMVQAAERANKPAACTVLTNDDLTGEISVAKCQPTAAAAPAAASGEPASMASPAAAAPAASTPALAAEAAPAEAAPAASAPAAAAPPPNLRTGPPPPAPDDPTPDEIHGVTNRWHTYDLEGHPDITYHLYDPYHQNPIKGDFPIAGNWFLTANAVQTMVFKSRRNLDFSNVFADQIAAGTLKFFSHNNFYAENLIFGADLRRYDDNFVPSNFRFHLDGVLDYRQGINAFNNGNNTATHVFDAFADVRLADFGTENFDLMFLRAGFQGFKSDFHGLIFNDAGLGGRIFGEKYRHRLRYDVAYFKLFQKNPISGFIDLTKPSRHQVGIVRLSWDDFIKLGWNSEWTFHYNHDGRPTDGFDVNTYYLGGAFNGHLGRWIFNPAVYAVTGHAQHLELGVPANHFVAAWMGLLDLEYPLDYWTFRVGYVYASGDSNPNDRRDTGFDAISDGVVLFGGPLSYWVGENVRFGSGNFMRANSLLPSLRGINDVANYVNPGVQVINLGVDNNLSPRVQLSTNLNYVRFNETGAYVNRVVIQDLNSGIEWNIFIRWKPFLHNFNQNFVVDNGFSILHPLAGLRGAFQNGNTVYSSFTALRFIF